MPSNYTDWLSSNVKSSTPSMTAEEARVRAPWLKGPFGGTTDSQSNGMADLVVKIMKTKFSDYVNSNNATFTNKLPAGSEEASVSAYDSGGGGTIMMGKIKKDITTYSNTGQLWAGSANTDDVIDALGTTLHETMHTRQNIDTTGSQKYGMPKDVVDKKEWVNMLQDANAASFPSIGKDPMLYNGDTLNEFLATAVAIQDMKARGIQPTKIFKKPADAMDALNKKYPWLVNYIDYNSKPEQNKNTDSMVGFKGDSLLDSFKKLVSGD